MRQEIQIREVSLEELTGLIDEINPTEIRDYGYASVARYKDEVTGDFIHLSLANGKNIILN